MHEVKERKIRKVYDAQLSREYAISDMRKNMDDIQQSNCRGILIKISDTECKCNRPDCDGKAIRADYISVGTDDSDLFLVIQSLLDKSTVVKDAIQSMLNTDTILNNLKGKVH